MKSPAPTPKPVVAGLIGLALILLLTAFKEGDTGWSKRIETPLLAEPKPLAAATGKVGFAAPLKIRELRGAWLRVQADDLSGWVFAGNLTDEKPTLAPAAGLTQVSADATDTVAAARPLTEAAEGYAARHAGGDEKADVEWVDTAAAAVGDDAIIAYLQANEKGEYRP